MEIKDIREDELKKVNDMYEQNSYWLECDSLDFVINYLERCECCHEIVFKDDLAERELWNGEHCMCCLDCQKEVDADNKLYRGCEPDPYDIYMDRKMEQEME